MLTEPVTDRERTQKEVQNVKLELITGPIKPDRDAQ
jgi:hypothetical protein